MLKKFIVQVLCLSVLFSGAVYGKDVSKYAAEGPWVLSLTNEKLSKYTINADRDTDLDGTFGFNVNAMMFGRISDDIVKGARLDASTEAAMFVTYPHHERHEGSNFIKAFTKDGTSLIVVFRVGAGTKNPHMTMKWKSEEAGAVEWWRNPSWTTDTGTDVAPINSNENSSNVSILEGDASGSFVAGNVVLDPTGISTASAVLIYEEPVWSTNQTPATASEGARDEHILLPGEEYGIAITAASGGLWLYLDWYEHTPRN